MPGMVAGACRHRVLHLNEDIPSPTGVRQAGRIRPSDYPCPTMLTTPTDNLAALDDETLAHIDIRAILDWLATPASEKAEDELEPLHRHLTALRNTRTPPHQRHKVLDLLYTRAHSAIERLLPGLTGVSLPLSRKTRHTVRGAQDILLMVAEDYLATLDDRDEHLIKGLRRPRETTLWRILDALYYHLLISDYAAAPAGVGVWRMLHRAFRTAAEEDHAGTMIQGADATLQDLYLRALLLACAQPASFTSQEIVLVADYVRRFANRAVMLGTGNNVEAESGFWIDADQDSPPTADKRRPPPDGALRFDCERLAELVEEQLQALDAGITADALDLPPLAASAAGHGVLRRLAQYWGHPAKRRFPRRRQNYRAVLCVGLEALWQLFREDHTRAGDITSWMVTNESPDGYALMHVSGKTSKISAGDIVAVRTENSEEWQICIVRWAQSENPEHLEIGMQILANRATPATLAAPAGSDSAARYAVLILPPVPPLRPYESLITPSGATHASKGKLVLMLEKENLELREIRATGLDEQTSSIEMLSIRFDPMPG